MLRNLITLYNSTMRGLCKAVSRVFSFLEFRLIDGIELYLRVGLWLRGYELPLMINTDMEVKKYNE